MGQTLSNGVYLPNEGERNCYAGLASNWQILNTAVGAIAEKAPLVHTHTVSQITDFPAYGNAAGTICEGNDSRLSDARTPVAHTHTKSDVTDLLNSNFIPSANNSYDLGSASYQWNNLYAKNYYYNGVAWGLDKANEWTGANSFYKSIQIHGGRNAYIMPEFGASYSGLAFGTVEFKQSFKFGDWVDNNSTIGLNTSNAYVEIYAGLDSSDSVNKVRLHPSPNATIAELGTATAKWKTLNGINPGALSFPRIVAADSRTIDRTNWDYTGNNWNTVDTSAMDGWGYIYIKNCAIGDYILIRRGGTTGDRPTQSTVPILAQDNKYYLYISFPIVKNTSVYALIKTSGTVDTSVVYPCQGTILTA